MRAGVISLSRGQMESVVQHSQVFLSRLATSFRAHFVFFVLVITYLSGMMIVLNLAGMQVEMGPLWMLRTFLGFIVPTTLLSILIMRFLHMIYYVRPEGSPTIYLAKDIWQFLSSPRRLLNAIPMIFVLIYFVLCFSTIKDAVPLVNPFSWDMTFMELDRTLHFGMDPWRILHPILGYAPITFLLNIIYNVWFVVVWMAWVWLAFAEKQSALRLQYLIAYFLSWSIGGSLLAIVFSSAGPVYYGNLDLGANPYAPLMSYLRATSEIVPLWAINTQDLLWEAYLNNGQGLVSGISAMPSMHNTAAFMIALLGWADQFALRASLGHCLRLAFSLGSIHLGWHYAVDAYLGFAIAGLSWVLSGDFCSLVFGARFRQKTRDTVERNVGRRLARSVRALYGVFTPVCYFICQMNPNKKVLVQCLNYLSSRFFRSLCCCRRVWIF